MEDLNVDMGLCTGCRSCEVACALEHAIVSEQEAQALLETVGAPVDVERGIKLQTSVAYARFERCLHCTDAPCVIACPNGAMRTDETHGVVWVDSSRCQACFMCAMVCPFGAISAHPITGRALKCDGCRERLLRGDGPACVAACTTGALTVGGAESAVRARQRDKAREIAEAMGLPHMSRTRSR